MQPTSISRIILLTGEAEAPVLAEILRLHNPALEIMAAYTRADLEEACDTVTPSTRLLSFCSPVIVPGALLEKLPGPSYNFHPGPPDRPGRYPSVFALYDNAERFGITVHEMRASVDSGPIVASEYFTILADCDLETLEAMTFFTLVTTFKRLAFHMATNAAPLPRQMTLWRGRKTTKADCDALAVVTPDMPPEEAARRRRACGIHMLRRL